MTTQEFSNEFDVLYNNITSNQAPGLDEYEKSIFLTKAQNELVKNYFNPKGNKYQEGFDDNRKRQIDFSVLIRVKELINLEKELVKFDDRSYVYVYPEDAWIPINESVADSTNKAYQVIPLSYEEYVRLMSKPYKYPHKSQVWRLFNNANSGVLIPGRHTEESEEVTITASNNSDKIIRLILKAESSSTIFTKSTVSNSGPIIEITISLPLNLSSVKWWGIHLLNSNSGYYDKETVDLTGPWNGVQSIFPAFTPTEEKVYADFTIFPATESSSIVSEIIGKFTSTPTYKIRYVKKPTPIILKDLSNTGLSIEGKSKITQCILPEEIHPEILQRAVELAKSAYQGDLNSTLELGKRSE